MEGLGELTVQGIRLEALVLGPSPERAPTLVFLHGGLSCLANWRDLPRTLAQATGCGALVYSRRGHGRSEPGPSRWPVSFMHDEAAIGLPEVLRTAGVREPILVGHSDGASIALLYAGGPSPSFPPPLGLALLAPHVFVEPLTVESIARLREEPERKAFLTRLERHHGKGASSLFQAWSEVWLSDDFRSWNIEHCAGRVRCPILLIQGDMDEYGTLAQVESVRSHAHAKVETVVLPGCGHVPHRDRGEETLQALSTFVRTLIG